ncbi:MAG TPA: uracil-xanthine permease, partial [Mollicutes bacterium]|nr:uracil-xanthine permease [Mollicutes bacterium]
MKEKKLLLDVYDRPPALKWLVFSLQHVFAMFGATILVPMLVNAGAGEEVLSIPVTLFTSGLGTLIYIICTKGKSPVYLGSSFAFITPMVVGFASAGKAGVFTAIVVVGLIYVLFAVLIKFIGKEWINKLLPPIIIGPMIMIIGLSLAPSALQQIGLLENQEFIWQNAVVALITFSVTVGINVYAKGFLKVIPF